MLSFSRCLGRSNKSDTLNSNQSTLIKQPKLTKNYQTPTTRTETTPTNNSENSFPRSPVMSWCSVTSVKNFCHNFKSQEQHTQSIKESSQPFNSISLTNPETSIDINSNLNLTNTIQESQEDQLNIPRQSYSNDPFAPPTPRVTHIDSFSTLSLSQSESLRSSIHSNQIEPLTLTEISSDNNNLILTLPDNVCLPNITRLSNFDFNEWNDTWLGNSTSPSRLRNTSISSLRISPSPTLTYRPQHYNPSNTHPSTPPQTPGNHIVYSSPTKDIDHIPFSKS